MEIVVSGPGADGRFVNRSVPSNRVVWVQADWTGAGDQVAQAFEDFYAHNYDECLIPLSDYVKRSKIRWRQQIAYGAVMYAASRRGKHRNALQIAAGFHQSEPPEFLYAMLPVSWSTPPPNSTRDREAATGLGHNNPAVQLIAASWLLSGSRRQQADNVLATLASNANDPLIAKLAYVVRWRTLAGAKVREQLPRWQSVIDQLPLAVQPGPMTTIADRLQASGMEHEALSWWLQVANLGKGAGILAQHASTKVAAITAKDKAE